MASVVLLGVDDATRESVERAGDGELLLTAESVDEIAQRIGDAADVEAVVVGSRLASPIEAIQRIHALDRTIPVLIVAEPKRHDDIRRALQLAPLIGPDVRQFTAPAPDAVAEEVQLAVERRRLRRRHVDVTRATSERVPSRIGALAEIVEQLDRALEYAPVGVVTVDRLGRLLQWNLVAGRILRLDQLRRRARSIGELFPGADSVERLLAAAFSSGGASGPARIELRQLPDRPRFIEMSATAIRRGDEESAVLVMNDVTERVTAEQDLTESAHRAALGADIGRALTADEPLRVRLQRCADAVVAHLHAAFARIWTLSDDGQELELQASAGIYTRTDGTHSRIPVGSLKIGVIAKERRPHLTNDVTSDPRIGDQEWARREGMVAFAGYPLLVGERLVGVLAMFSRRHVDELTLRALGSVADSIALAIEKADADEQLKQALRQEQDAREAAEQTKARLSFLAEASAILSASLDYETTLGIIARLAVPVLADWCLVDLVEDDGSVRRVAMAHSDAAKEQLVRDLSRRYPMDLESSHGAPGVIRRGASELAAQVSEEMLVAVARDEEHLAMLRQLGLASSMCVPLKARGRTLGAITLMSGDGRRRFTHEDVAFAEELAHRAALAVDNARLFAQERISRAEAEAAQRRLGFLASATEVLTSSLDYEATVERLARLIVPELADWCVVDLLEGNELRRVAVANADPQKASLARELQRRYPAKPDAPHGPAAVVRSGRPELYTKPSEEAVRASAYDERHVEVVWSLGITSGMIVPLLLGPRTIGTLTFVAAESGRVYAESDLRFAEELARHAALAIENARLFREAQAAEQRVTDLVDSLDAIVWEADAEEGRIGFISRRVEELTGHPVERWVENPLLWAELIHPADRAATMATRREAIKQARNHDVEYRIVAADGTSHWVRDVVHIIKDESGRAVRLRGVTVDVSSKRVAELRQEARRKITAILSASASLADATTRTMQVICETLEWDFGALWEIDDRAQRIRCVSLWHAPDVVLREFEEATRRASFPRGVGLPGRVWAAGVAAWIPDVMRDGNFSRASVAAREGMHSAFGIPIASASGTVGVMEFFSREIREPDHDLLQLMASLGAQVGQFIERKRAEDALTESEARKTAILQSSLDCLITMDHAGRIVEFNPASERAFGYRREEAVGRQLAELIIPPDLRAAHYAGLEQFARTGTGRVIGNRIEMRAMRRDGSEFPVEVTVTKVDLPGSPLFTGYIRDITERKRVEQALRESEEMFRSLSNSSPIGIFLADERGRALYTNPRCQAICGFTEEEGYGEGWVRFIHPDDAASVLAEWVAATHSGIEFTREFRWRWRDGSVRWSSMRAAPIHTGDGRVSRYVGTVEDITERRFVEEQLRFQNALLESESEATLDGILIVGTDGTVLSTNKRFADMWRIPDEILAMASDKALLDYVVGSLIDPDEFLERVQYLYEHPDERSRDEIRLRDGRTFDRWSTPLLSADGVLYGRAWYFRDITEDRRNEQSLRENEERFAFLAEASSVLSMSLDYQRTLEALARLTVPYLADWCVIDVIESDGSARRVAIAHTDPEKVALARGMELNRQYEIDPQAEYGVSKVIRTGRPEFAPQIPEAWLERHAGTQEYFDLLRGMGFHAYICVPLVARGRILGVMTLVTAESKREYGAVHLAIAEELARRAALSVDNARLYRDRADVARTLQESLLPPRLPEIPGIDVAARYHAAVEGNEVGGDFYDLFKTRRNSWAVVVGDVCGKGAEAATVTALARYTIRTVAMQMRKPTRILSMLNDAMLHQRSDSRFCTVAYGRLDLDEGSIRMEISCGGHPPPLLLRADGSLEVAAAPGTLLGMFPDPVLTDQTVHLRSGDTLVFYTDGVTEARGRAGHFGEERLHEVLATCAGFDAAGTAECIERAALDFQQGRPRDDIALLVIRVP